MATKITRGELRGIYNLGGTNYFFIVPEASFFLASSATPFSKQGGRERGRWGAGR
jgi:hypothetical protein